MSNMAKRRIPRCMSTQHPDNATTPFFSNSSVIEGEAEVREAHYAYSQLGCEEQMWDSEGKEADSFVVKKLLSAYPQFFEQNILGRDVFLTLRVPNPSVEKKEGKILLEALESIPRSFDSARAFYSIAAEEGLVDARGTAPVFEVILPMTTSAVEVDRVWNYYKNFVAGKSSRPVSQGDVSVGEWVGGFEPAEISVIPLVENKESMEKIDSIVGHFLKGKNIVQQRVFLARSDPALNYGSLPAVLLVKNALQKLAAVEEKTSVEILPIIGTGSAPFRGNFKPTNAGELAREYPSIQTFTLQSAFKYDYPEEEVKKAVGLLNSSKRGKPTVVDEAQSMEIIERVSTEYISQVQLLAPAINKLSSLIPNRRKRHLHVGLFGYSRSVTGLSLPRAITFCASLYSIGIPPELMGLNALKPADFEYLNGIYPQFHSDVADATQFLNRKILAKFPTIEGKITASLENFEFETDLAHEQSTSIIWDAFEKNDLPKARVEVEKAARMRKFLG